MTESEREARNYNCPRFGRPVVFAYLFEGRAGTAPRAVECSGAIECGVERTGADGAHEYDWSECPLRPELMRRGFLPA